MDCVLIFTPTFKSLFDMANATNISFTKRVYITLHGKTTMCVTSTPFFGFKFTKVTNRWHFINVKNLILCNVKKKSFKKWVQQTETSVRWCRLIWKFLQCNTTAKFVSQFLIPSDADIKLQWNDGQINAKPFDCAKIQINFDLKDWFS